MSESSPISRRIGRQAIPRSTAGVGLVELMVVVTIISMLMALSIPSYQRIQRKARGAAIANDFRVFTAVLQARAHENGSWPAETAAGVVPDVITKDDIQLETWIGPTAIGGRFDWEFNQLHNGVRYRAALALVDTADAPLLVDIGLYQEIDAVLDDGNLNTGNLRLGNSNCLLFIIEP
ncbi:MAG: type II secretion system protein [bacterium]|nr:type II secretion system protein [bacterium]MDI1335314.1 type II secretion system protein [Lacunisphaera sp.]